MTNETPAQDLRSALEQIQLLASNHGGWLETDPAKLVKDIHDHASAALAQPAENAKGGEVVTDPLRAALAEGFCISNSAGHPDPAERSYRLIFSFSSLEALQLAHSAYVAHPPAAEPVGLRESRNYWKFRDSNERPWMLGLGQQFGEQWANGRVATRVTEIGCRSDGWFNAVLIEFEPGGECRTFSQDDIAALATLSAAPDRVEVGRASLDANDIADIIAECVSGPNMHRSERLKANHRLDQLTAANRILAALKPADATPAGEAVQMSDSKFEEVATAFAKEFYGPGFDPFQNPEAYDLIERGLRAALSTPPALDEGDAK